MCRYPESSPCPFCAGRRILSGFNDLASQNPQIASEWHPTKNEDFKPTMVSPGSAKKVWWFSEACGHEWLDMISERTRTRRTKGCRVCTGIEVFPGFNDLATVYPEVAKFWHPTKNAVTASEVLPGVRMKKYWWLGKCGHEWEAKPVTMTSNNRTGTGCPYCCGKKVLIGENDLLTLVPDISIIWDYEKNFPLTPQSVTVRSAKVVSWKCPLGHEWQSTICLQTVNGATCPFCEGRRVFAGLNDFATTHPMMASQWHPTKNGSLKPTEVSYGSSFKVWWKCLLNHEWRTILSSRTSANGGCPICSGQELLVGYNDLSTTNPLFASEWNYVKNGHLLPTMVQSGTNKSVWWICKLDHEWKVSPNSRSKEGTGCPFCSNSRVLSGFNDFATSSPNLMAEWHPTKNTNIDPYVLPRWTSQKIWWVGKDCNHEWHAAINSRQQGHGCVTCNKSGSSKIERDLYSEIKNLIPDTEHNVIVPVAWRRNKSARVDILIPSLNTIVEYDGSYWHANKMAKDTEKTQSLLDAGYKVVRVRDNPLPLLSIQDGSLIQLTHNKESASTMADMIFLDLMTSR